MEEKRQRRGEVQSEKDTKEQTVSMSRQRRPVVAARQLKISSGNRKLVRLKRTAPPDIKGSCCKIGKVL